MKRVLSLILAVIMLTSVVGCSTSGNTSDASEYLLAKAVYPEMAPYPVDMEYIDQKTGEFDNEGFSKVYKAWSEEQRARRLPEGSTDTLTGFLETSIPQFLSGAETENRVYSPLNVYMALGMLAELTDGNSRQQILDLLGSPDIETLRQQATAIWKSNYNDDGATTTVLVSSLWLDEDINFVQPTLDKLADTFYTSSYRGQMGTDEFNKALKAWLNEQTGGLLEEQAAQIEMDAETLMALATTIYFQAKWSSEFQEERTEESKQPCLVRGMCGIFPYLRRIQSLCCSTRMEQDGL